ncbi:short chain dehydrogenase/reductase family [Xylaria sp. CBS 124048]|nr:short chain dehydrogenase/reductase family [Xylaria sp. CBS 124048]
MEINSLFDVKGKVVLVTGGAASYFTQSVKEPNMADERKWRMITEGFVANGAKVYIASRDAKACEKTAAELTARGPGSCIAIPADLLQLSECKRLVAELQTRESRLHVLVNNSGATWGARLEEYPDEQFSRVLTLNLHRAFTLTQLLLPLLEVVGAESSDKENPATVINIGSINGLTVPNFETYSYSASKAGLHHLTRHLSQNLGPRGITVNALACGPFDTKMMAFSMKNFRDVIEEGNPMKRHGRPGDVAGTCIFLASRAGSYVNGATINVDGGVHLAPKM